MNHYDVFTLAAGRCESSLLPFFCYITYKYTITPNEIKQGIYNQLNTI